jgi:3-hydroxyacyl-[acyl-carrier-protein] dehydratase
MVNMNAAQILSRLPYTKPFLFVDNLTEYDENHITGTYTYNKELDFYKGHFAGSPLTPGAILTETMAQVGVVCLGIYLLGGDWHKEIQIALTSADTEYLKPVFPGETVTVTSQKIYFRFGKLKCKTIMKNQNGEEVCRAIIAGIIRNINE